MRDGIVAAIRIPLARLGFDSNRSEIGISRSTSRIFLIDILIPAIGCPCGSSRGPPIC
jgi:hypothetical protein